MTDHSSKLPQAQDGTHVQTGPEGGPATLDGRKIEIINAPNSISVADGMAIEWKATTVLPGPGGMDAAIEMVDGLPCLRIDTPADTGWSRFACNFPRETDMPLIGMRLLIKIQQDPTVGATVRVKPMIASTRRANLSREGQGETSAPLTLTCDVWHEIRGVFACAPRSATFQTDLIINLPKNARILIAAIDARWIGADLPQTLQDSFAQQPASVVVPYDATPLTGPVTDVAGKPAVFAASVSVSVDDVSGWMLASDAGMRIAVDGVEDVATGLPIDIGGGVIVAEGFSLQTTVLMSKDTPVVISGQFTDGTSQQIKSLSFAHPFGVLLPRGEDPEPVPETARNFWGNVDTLDVDGATGWIARPGRTLSGDPVTVSLVIDGTVAAFARTGLPRPDVTDAGLGPLNCGFSLSFPDSFFDGQDHVVEIIEVDTDLLVPGGQATLNYTLDGVTFADPSKATILGWASGGPHVLIGFAGGTPVPVPLDQEVPSFAPGNAKGFSLPIPPELCNGALHYAEVLFSTGEAMLTGSPVGFRVLPDTSLVTVQNVQGRQATVRVTDVAGTGFDLALGVLVDGKRIYGGRSDESRVGPGIAEDRGVGYFSFPMPRGAGRIALQDESGITPLLLAQFDLDTSDADATLTPLTDFSRKALGDKAYRTIRDTFETFATSNAPASFDALWYLNTYPDAAAQVASGDYATALEHYHRKGAREGLSPNPFFNEAEVLRLRPDLALAKAEGNIPCAFAALLDTGPQGRDAFAPIDPKAFAGMIEPDPLAGLMDSILVQRDHIAQILQQDPEPEDDDEVLHAAVVPPPSTEQSASQSVYAAWMARLALPPKSRAEIDADEAAAAEEIRKSHLMRTPLVSIIMPTFNRAYTLGEAVQSVLDQSYENWELLICDDASTDRTPEVMRQFKDPRIRYMQFTKSAGAGEVRNKGLRFAQGEYISFLDSDNLWNPMFLDVMLRRLMAKPGSALAYAGFIDTEIVGAQVTFHHTSCRPFQPVTLSNRNFMDLNSIVYHRRVHDWLGGFDGSLPRLQDWDLMLRHTSIFRPLQVNHFMVFYRRNVAWGQVTHLFMNTATRGTVLDKTEARLEREHTNLSINWPARGRVTVLAGPSTTARVNAHMIARLALRHSDVEVIDFSGEGLSALPALDGVSMVSLPKSILNTPQRLAYALQDRLGGAVVGLGLSDSLLAQICPPVSRAGEAVYGLVMTSQGPVLRNIRVQNVEFPLGALPLEMPDKDTVTTENVLEPAPILLMMDRAEYGDIKMLNSLAELARKAKTPDILIPPPGFEGPVWYTVRKGEVTSHTLSLDEGLALLARGTKLAVVTPQIGDLSTFGFSLLSTLQSLGIALAVVPSRQQDGIASDWLATKAAYPLTQKDYAWVFDKLGKLLADKKGMDGFSDRGLVAYRVVQHPELVQERLDHFLYRVLFDNPKPEVRDV